jgi:hypothetical protein
MKDDGVAQNQSAIHHFRISEDDLASLESELPRLLDASMLSCNNPITRKRWQMVKEIVSNVRWDYGSPAEVQIIPADDADHSL